MAGTHELFWNQKTIPIYAVASDVTQVRKLGNFAQKLNVRLATVTESAVVTDIMESTMAELANMPTVSEIASWCDFDESDDLAGLLCWVPKRQQKPAFSRPSPSSSWVMQVDGSSGTPDAKKER